MDFSKFFYNKKKSIVFLTGISSFFKKLFLNYLLSFSKWNHFSFSFFFFFLGDSHIRFIFFFLRFSFFFSFVFPSFFPSFCLFSFYNSFFTSAFFFNVLSLRLLFLLSLSFDSHYPFNSIFSLYLRKDLMIYVILRYKQIKI